MPHCCKLLQPHKGRRATDMSIIRSKPIPIPPREADPHLHDEMITSREAAEIYDAATWRMFELITSARLRAAASSNFYYCRGEDHPTSSQQDDRDDATLAATATSSSQQQLQRDATRHRDRVYSPIPEPPSVPHQPPSSLMDGVFTMDL
jgi:hypothetical protein